MYLASEYFIYVEVFLHFEQKTYPSGKIIFTYNFCGSNMLSENNFSKGKKGLTLINFMIFPQIKLHEHSVWFGILKE